jgi:hypothetical protein
MVFLEWALNRARANTLMDGHSTRTNKAHPAAIRMTDFVTSNPYHLITLLNTTSRFVTGVL